MGWRRTLGMVAPLLVLTAGCGLTLGSQGAAEEAKRNLNPVAPVPAVQVGGGDGPATAAGGTTPDGAPIAGGSGEPEFDAAGNPITTTTVDPITGLTVPTSTIPGAVGSTPGSGSVPRSSGGSGIFGGSATPATTPGSTLRTDPYVVPPTIAPDLPTEPSARERLCAAFGPVRLAYINITSPSTDAGNFLARVTELQRAFKVLQPLLPASAQDAGAEVNQILSDVVQSATVAADKFSDTILAALGRAAPVVTNRIIPAVPPECVGPPL